MLLQVVSLAVLSSAGPVETRDIAFGRAKAGCSYDGTAYVCPPSSELGARVEMTLQHPPSTAVTVTLADSERCLTPGVALTIRALQPVVVDGAGVKLTVDGGVVVPTLGVAGKRVTPGALRLDAGEKLDLMVVDDAGGGACWRRRSARLVVPVGRELIEWQATFADSPTALTTAIRATPEPPQPAPLTPPVPPAGYDGAVPPPDATLRTVAMVGGGVVGAVAGAGLGLLIATRDGGDPLDPNALVPTALFTGLFGLSGAGLAALVVEPTPHPRAAEFAAYEKARAEHATASETATKQAAQHAAWQALQAQAP